MSTLDIVPTILQCNFFSTKISEKYKLFLHHLDQFSQDVSKKANLQKDWNCPWVSKDGSRLKQAIR